MTELLKDRYTIQYLEHLGGTVKQHHNLFNETAFLLSVFDQQWPQRELKDRMRHIAQCLQQHIQCDYADSIEILKKVAPDFGGFEAMFFPEFVERCGLDDWEVSIPALAFFTRYSSSEFAVRPFIIRDSERMMAQMLIWSKDNNEHLRRLASEGSRPRLPWAMALPDFKSSPAPILPILENLKQDPSLYVRRSVANNFNDIAKDNPHVTLEIAGQWLGNHKDTDWLVKHACRTLLKKGDPRALRLFGYINQSANVFGLTLSKSELAIGGSLNFEFELISRDKGKLGKTRIEYAIDFVKANGKQSRKVFKISESDIKENNKHCRKTHHFKQLSTRQHYPGTHQLGIIVNGLEKQSMSFELLPVR